MNKLFSTLRNFVVSRFNSFKYAFHGWAYVLRTQKNAWIHMTATMLVIAAGIWLGLSRYEWAILLLVIGIVWIAEFLNTALEAILDIASPERHPLARIAKDVGAAAVLIAAVVAVAVGLLILGPPLLAKLGWG
ncbi:MAG TPA: diacylglycerol kinase family protein [Anaerolineaceae bacterium]|jgi:diacylglycerol kinase|nr:diacylglycerol kinase family protein [Anaerolineaceae bacterium]